MKSSLCEAGRSTKRARAVSMLILTAVVLAMAMALSACSSGGMFAKATETPTTMPTLPPTSTPKPTATEVPPTENACAYGHQNAFAHSNSQRQSRHDEKPGAEIVQ